MISSQTRVHLTGINAAQLVDFMVNCTDQEYQAWWPGTHLAFHTVECRPGYVGSVVYMDEYVGRRRVRMNAVVTEFLPGERVVWQLKQVLRLPAWLALEAVDEGGGVDLSHTIHAGFRGPGRVLDPLFRLYFSAGFERAMDEHARAEFPMLASMLNGSDPHGA